MLPKYAGFWLSSIMLGWTLANGVLMSSIQDLLNTLAGEPVIFSAVVFVAVFTAALALGWRFLLPTPEGPRRPASAAELERRSRGADIA